MENKVIQDRLALLRKKMQEEGIDFYMMPTADFHNSEYVNDYTIFLCTLQSYFEGFSINWIFMSVLPLIPSTDP